MIFKWESQEQRLRRFMAISPKKKLEWLCQMNNFLLKASNKKRRDIYWRLRTSR
ncbi:MAG: hypothetical protein HZB36_00420 [Candidatus Omnitrophica bacterium]|nr:hypothetical protein [Candidatus Omnitrophota bacterium]